MCENWRSALEEITNGKCRGCPVCDGKACAGEIPGMGGYDKGLSFQNNYFSWENIIVPHDHNSIPKIAVGPMTGTDENMGDFMPEKDFHALLVQSAKRASVLSCIGDGVPDYKLLSGAEALRAADTLGYVFFKPYPNKMLYERYTWVEDTSLAVGLDIDSYKIATMTGKAVLEKKTVTQLLDLKTQFKKPFIIKGISTWDDVDLVKQVKPDIAVISNHGGRVSANAEGTALTLQRWGAELKNVCGELWVDGGLRTKKHLLKASTLGADCVMIGRPFIQGLAFFGENAVTRILEDIFNV